MTTASALFHAIEYLAIVGWSVQKRHADRQNLLGLLAWFAPRWGITLTLFVVILGIIPGILFALWFSLYAHAVVLENLGGTAALSRSKALVRPHLGTLIILGLLVGAITILLQMGAGMIPQKHVAFLLQVLIASGITLFSTAAFVVFYFSCRCAVENFDLEHLAATIDSGAEAPEKIAGAEF